MATTLLVKLLRLGHDVQRFSYRNVMMQCSPFPSNGAKIAMAGMEKAHSEFNTERIAKHLLDLIETGAYDAPWAEIL